MTPNELEKAGPIATTSVTATHVDVQPQPFAGRLGGNQQYTLTNTNRAPNGSPLDEPDAVRNAKWRSLLELQGFTSRRLWKLAFIEGVGTMLQVFISGLLALGLVPTATETSVGPVFTVTYAALTQLILLTLFLFAAAPITGAHFNPLITMGTFFTGLTSLPRAVLYILFQCIGAVVGAFIVRGTMGLQPEQMQIVPGCYIDTSKVTAGQAFGFETMTSFTALFLAFGLGLDPRNAPTFGPSLAPFLVGLSSCLAVFSAGIARPGYLGTSNNPARCLGLMAAAQRFDYHYVHWFGDITAAMVNAILYWTVPPYVKA